jgi:hypothetical protein
MSFAIQSNRNVQEWAVLPMLAVLHVGFGVGISKAFIWARRKFNVTYDMVGGNDDGDIDDGELGEVGESSGVVMSPLGSDAGQSVRNGSRRSGRRSRRFTMDDAIIVRLFL